MLTIFLWFGILKVWDEIGNGSYRVFVKLSNCSLGTMHDERI